MQLTPITLAVTIFLVLGLGHRLTAVLLALAMLASGGAGMAGGMVVCVDRGGGISVEGPHSPHSDCHGTGHEDADASLGFSFEDHEGDCSDLTVDVQGAGRVDRFDGRLYGAGGPDQFSRVLLCAAVRLNWVEASHSGARVDRSLVPVRADLAALRAVILVI